MARSVRSKKFIIGQTDRCGHNGQAILQKHRLFPKDWIGISGLDRCLTVHIIQIIPMLYFAAGTTLAEAASLIWGIIVCGRYFFHWASTRRLSVRKHMAPQPV